VFSFTAGETHPQNDESKSGISFHPLSFCPFPEIGSWTVSRAWIRVYHRFLGESRRKIEKQKIFCSKLFRHFYMTQAWFYRDNILTQYFIYAYYHIIFNEPVLKKLVVSIFSFVITATFSVYKSYIDIF
jgi:hypothetical protein